MPHATPAPSHTTPGGTHTITTLLRCCPAALLRTLPPAALIRLVVFFLTGMVAMIMMRTLHKEISSYNSRYDAVAGGLTDEEVTLTVAVEWRVQWRVPWRVEWPVDGSGSSSS